MRSTSTLTTASFYENKSFFLSKSIDDIHISGNNHITQGSLNVFSLQIGNFDITNDPDITWKSSNTSVAIVDSNIILAINEGEATISVEFHGKTLKTFDIKVDINTLPDEDESIVKEAEELLSKMDLKTKIGQMFFVGLSGTVIDSNIIQAIDECHFGNIIYMAYNVKNYSTLANLTNTIQDKLITTNGVPGFISVDQEGGNVARLVSGATHFIGAMAMGATGNEDNTYELGKAMGEELYNYGIRVDFTPVLDVNVNPDNPVIGIRSYGDKPMQVALFGNNMTKGLAKSNIIGCAKHFPGHGNTTVDSHSGLPVITSTKEALYKIELAPFMSAIASGIDAIMTTHIIFTAFDDVYPATLSKEVLTKLLREQMHFKGLIITDGMQMAGVTKNYGGHEVISVLAIEAGVDILLYTSNDAPRISHGALMNAVNNGTISIERINESVKRILIKKIKYGIIKNYKAEGKNIDELLEKHKEMNLRFAKESLTLLKGTFNGLDKSKSTLIVAPKKTTLTNENFAEYAAEYLKSKGMSICDYEVVSQNMTDSEVSTNIEKVKQYEQVVLAFDNVKVQEYTNTISFVNSVAAMDKELVVVALTTPYDLMAYDKEKIKTYICTYNYQEATVKALSMYLNGEFTAQGKFPLSKEGFE
jgi:beta-N-acetylhexosaminidase